MRQKYSSHNTRPHLCGLPLSRKTTVFGYNFSAANIPLKTAKNLCNVFRKINQPFR